MKKHIERRSANNLAINGGKPVRSQWLAYNRQSVDKADRLAVDRALKGEMITRGPCVTAFEHAIAEHAEMPYAVAFSSATAGLHAVMSMIGVKADSKVITSPNTFAATANSVLYCGGKVLFQDIEAKTMNLDPNNLTGLDEALAVVPVDFAGNPVDYSTFQALQKKHKFRLIVDAAHSLGATYNKRPVGSFGDIVVFSFHPVKSITTGEGGVVVLKDAHEAEYLRTFKSHGICRTNTPGYYRQEFLGFNYHITDLQCALGLSQLKKLKKFTKRRREIVEAYDEFFAQYSGLQLPTQTPGAQSSWHLYPLRLPLKNLSVDRDRFLVALQAENIGANVHYIPVYWHPYYEGLGFKRGLCPVAEREYLREISLPVFPDMKSKDIKDVCQGVAKVLEAYWI